MTSQTLPSPTSVLTSSVTTPAPGNCKDKVSTITYIEVNTKTSEGSVFVESISGSSTVTYTKENAAIGMIANPVSSKYGIIVAAFAAVSFVLGIGI
ncbi:AHL_G0041800.mRNA.1.CDS.1 [Saccharomyces cerevisiae]|nr:AVB_G0041250.mRNA.1.CDS.1 [Saccharomyces cerevisiae]CAI4679812.1 CPG_1a_G0041750.mRNA.1.CDS.1 [Saccharomyces cerevisiae]CAI4895784.1 AHL_G0041800.mRNA.1.CDS.1 [Saccharomyces cerevisiae]CAI6841819.1 AHL_G0041800.mRNA.1.CDS.1 [Saccharomyces cerevisiae]CAI7237359.1 AVB_G0041250.mRNA.1.CDS.1 [Saccharomyces cerevisiae]